MKYSLDTNIVSEILRNNEIVQKNFNKALQENSKIYICSIVYYEVVRGLKAASKFNFLRNFLEINNNLPHLTLDKDNYKTIEKAIEIYVQLHKGKQIEDNDIFIAAIAIVNDCTLITANAKHFERVEGLKLINWREI